MKQIKDYASERGITTQAVYQLIDNHKVELNEYIVKQGRTRFLLPEAEKILDSYRNKAQIVIEKQDRIDEIERLNVENKNLLLKVATQADKIATLAEEAKNNAILIAEANNNAKLLEDKTKQLDEIKADRDELLDKLHRAETELERYRNAGILQRLFGFKKIDL